MDETTLSIRNLLKKNGDRLVLVESCTSGWIAAQFGAIPGISEFFCGSLVVYQNSSKHHWLGINQEILDDPKIGPVSELVTRQLANSVLEKTPDATIAAAITGHLGPGSPSGQDGTIFVSIARRSFVSIESVTTMLLRLDSPCPQDENDYIARLARQQEAGNALLTILRDVLEGNKISDEN